MAFSLIANTAAGPGANGGNTSAIDTTGADLIVVMVGRTPNAVTVSDNQGNTYTALTTRGSVQPFGRLYYTVAPTTNAAHTISVTGTGVYPFIGVQAWSGVDTASAFDVENGASGSGATLATGSVTPTNANSLVIAGIVFAGNSGGAVSIDNSFTISDTLAFANNVNWGGSMAHLHPRSTAVNPTWNITNAAQASAAIAVFKAAAAGGAFRSFYHPATNPLLRM